jgi:uncharacterized protein YgbK (DUF1537 family)
MILVIADDLTGAAELGGIGIKHGLSTVITTSIICLPAKSDLLIIATDTRSIPREAAEQVMHTLGDTLQLQLAGRSVLIYKKIDSVLRGHVLAEVNILKNKLAKRKALIVPANPGLGRTIVDGQYLLHGQPLHASSFSQDPEFPVTSSRIADMLSAGEKDVQVRTHQQAMPEKGIVVGEVQQAADLAGWCKQVDNDTLPVGAAEFFAALLQAHDLPATNTTVPAVPPQTPYLAIWGSSFHKSRAFVQQLQQQGFPVSYMPAAALTDGIVYQRWVNEIIDNLRAQGKGGMAVEPGMQENQATALAIRSVMANAAAYITTQVKVNELLVEGGATAAAVIRRLGPETLCPVAELAPGVIRMSVPEKNNLLLTMKPGSYEWPEGFITANKHASI